MRSQESGESSAIAEAEVEAKAWIDGREYTAANTIQGLRAEAESKRHVSENPIWGSVYIDFDPPRVCAIGLAEPENIWGLSFPSEDGVTKSSQES